MARYVEQTLRPQRSKALVVLGFTILVVALLDLGINLVQLYLVRVDDFNGTESPSVTSSSASSCIHSGVRKEWRTLSSNEKQSYISAVQCLSRKPSKLSTNTTLYDDFGYVHTIVGHTSKKIISSVKYPCY
jgi:hypothetical protein